jgi:hypothetical protein
MCRMRTVVEAQFIPSVYTIRGQWSALGREAQARGSLVRTTVRDMSSVIHEWPLQRIWPTIMPRCAIRDIYHGNLGLFNPFIGNIVVDRRVAPVRMHLARQDKTYIILQGHWFDDTLAFSTDSGRFVLVADVPRPMALDNYPRLQGILE